LNLKELAENQTQLANSVKRYDEPASSGSIIIGVDVAYSEEVATGAAVVMDNMTRETIASTTIIREIEAEYVPGFFQLREGPILIELVQNIKEKGVLLVDGNGILHPRRYGLASHIGVTLDRPTIGVAKKLLIGTIENRSQNYADIIYENEILGRAVWLGRKEPIFVSIGHRVSLDAAVQVVLNSSVSGYPEVLRRAHILSKTALFTL